MPIYVARLIQLAEQRVILLNDPSLDGRVHGFNAPGLALP